MAVGHEHGASLPEHPVLQHEGERAEVAHVDLDAPGGETVLDVGGDPVGAHPPLSGWQVVAPQEGDI